jgi:DNA repair protein RecN (Recombination protein N)
VVRAEARFAAVEAVFEWPEENELLDLLTDYGVEDDSSLILRREVSANGRGVARLNGRAVPVATLAAVGGLLVDIHGQSDHLSVLRRDRQLMVLDRYADLLSLRQQVAGAVARFSQLRSDLDELARGQRESEQRLDLLRFQVQEIETAALATNEEESLAAERNLLVNAERLATSSRAAHEALQGGNGSALDRLSEALVAARELTAIDGSLASLHDRLQSASYELDDVAQELRKYGDQIEYDPRRLAAVEERLTCWCD